MTLRRACGFIHGHRNYTGKSGFGGALRSLYRSFPDRYRDEVIPTDPSTNWGSFYHAKVLRCNVFCAIRRTTFCYLKFLYVVKTIHTNSHTQ